MKFKYIKQTNAVCLLASSLLLTSCASIMNGENEKFTVASQPSRATLIVDGMSVGETPKQIDLSRKNDHVLKLDLAGYQPTTIHLERNISGWLFGNIVFGGIIGLAVDTIDGAMYKLTPQEVSQYASQTGVKYIPKTHSVTVILVRNANKNWQKIGQLNKA